MPPHFRKTFCQFGARSIAGRRNKKEEKFLFSVWKIPGSPVFRQASIPCTSLKGLFRGFESFVLRMKPIFRQKSNPESQCLPHLLFEGKSIFADRLWQFSVYPAPAFPPIYQFPRFFRAIEISSSSPAYPRFPLPHPESHGV